MTLSKKWSNFNFQKRVLKKKAVCCEYEPNFEGYRYFWIDYEWPLYVADGQHYGNEAVRVINFQGDTGIGTAAGGVPIFTPNPVDMGLFLNSVQGGLNTADPEVYDIHIGGVYYTGPGGGWIARLGIVVKGVNTVTFNYNTIEYLEPPPFPETPRSVVLTNSVAYQPVTLETTITSQPFSGDINDLYFNTSGAPFYPVIGFPDQPDVHTFTAGTDPIFTCLQNVANVQGLCAGAFQGQPGGYNNVGFLQVYMNMLFGTKVVVSCVNNTGDSVTIRVSNVPNCPITLGPYEAVVRAPGCGAILGTVQFNWTVV